MAFRLRMGLVLCTVSYVPLTGIETGTMCRALCTVYHAMGLAPCNLHYVPCSGTGTVCHALCSTHQGWHQDIMHHRSALRTNTMHHTPEWYCAPAAPLCHTPAHTLHCAPTQAHHAPIHRANIDSARTCTVHWCFSDESCKRQSDFPFRKGKIMISGVLRCCCGAASSA